MTQQTWGAPPQQQFPAQGGYHAPVQQQQAPWGGQPQQQAPQQQGPAPVAVQTGDEFDDFFSGGVKGAPGFDFGASQNGGDKAVGAMVMGEIVEMAKMQQIDFATKRPLFWDDGAPRMQVAITLQTELRGWSGVKPKLIPIDEATQQPKGPEHDDGKRRVYVKGDMVRAVNVACAQAGQKPRKGGKLAVRVRGFEDVGKGNPKTLYDAQYVAAPEPVATDSFFEQPQQQAAPQANGFLQSQQLAPQTPPPASGFGGPAPGPQGQLNQQGQFQPGGYVPAPGAMPQQEPAYAGGSMAPQQQAPAQQTFPSTLGNNPAPAGPPEWAAPAGQGYAPPPEPQQQAAPGGFDAPPF